MSYCSKCGRQVPQGSYACPTCGARQKAAQRRINNIFSALMWERTTGVIMEFTLWCIVCFVALMSLIASIVGHGNITWILLLIFSCGLGVLMAFRLKPISMLYSVGIFNLLITIVHYACFAKSNTYMGYNSSYNAYNYTSIAEYSPLNITLFVIAVVLGVAILACGFVYNFTRARLENLLTILVIVDCAVIILLQIMMYAAPSLGTGMGILDANSYDSAVRIFANYRGFWLGSVTFWCLLIVIMLFYIFFFWGAMRSMPRKIREMGRGSRPVPMPSRSNGGLQGICGTYAGREISLNGSILTIGSGDEVHIKIYDASVSRKHCAIRFNTVSGLYEVQDVSKNGVFLANGTRLQRGVYSPVARGNVICIGSQAQQFRLL